MKSVAQALPTYTMSTFELPSKICDNLDALMCRFWWNPKKQEGMYLAWKARNHLYQPKENGGLGFRHTKDFNKALIGKLAWMVATKSDSLCMRMLRSKYKVRENWLRRDDAKNGSRKAIEKAKHLLVKGACYVVGDGKSIDVWRDSWIPWVEGFKPKPKDDTVNCNPLMVGNFRAGPEVWVAQAPPNFGCSLIIKY